MTVTTTSLTGVSSSAAASSAALPLGSSLTMAYQGDLVTAADGTVWIANTQTSPFSYTSDYSTCPDALKCPHPVMSGPKSGLWYAGAPGLAYKAADTLYCTSGTASVLEGDSSNGYFYYTSADGGANWTQRTFPNNKAYSVFYTSNKFIGLAASSTTNGIITGTDAVNWSSLTSISQSSVTDICSDGADNIVIIPSGGTGAQRSADGGATWSTVSLAATSASATSNSGGASWNAGAGLFIVATNVAGDYQTSPTSAVWTDRNTIATFAPYKNYFSAGNARFASNATTTVAFGVHGFFATTTDGLTWGNHGFISANVAGVAPVAYHDGTRFVAIYNDRVFYSVDGSTWTEGKRLTGSGTCLQFNGRALRTTLAQGRALLMTDPTATAPATIAPVANVAATQTATYYRIK